MRQKLLIAAMVLFAFSISSCADNAGYQESPTEQELPTEPYSGYGDSYDDDCIDVGEKVWVGSYDPDGLDRDGDGWGCESYGG